MPICSVSLVPGGWDLCERREQLKDFAEEKKKKKNQYFRKISLEAVYLADWSGEIHSRLEMEAAL